MSKKITVTARIPKEWLEEWRVWIIWHGGDFVVPRSKEEKAEELRRYQEGGEADETD